MQNWYTTVLYNVYIYIYIYIYSYEPKCEQSCGQGKCININLCNCTDTLYTGRFCNENYKFERKKILDFIISTITVAFLILTVVLIFLTFTYRKNPKIKGGINCW